VILTSAHSVLILLFFPETRRNVVETRVVTLRESTKLVFSLHLSAMQ
jgi:hypothetical protein